MSILLIITKHYAIARDRAHELGLPSHEWVAITGMHDIQKVLGTVNPRVERVGLPPSDLAQIELWVRTRMRLKREIPTPITDAAIKIGHATFGDNGDYDSFLYVDLEVARALERKLALAEDQLANRSE